jgi:HPt (histidine-containing phosphotransfer) domain-containing protein
MSDFDDRMAALRERFGARCGERAAQLAAALADGDRDAVVRIAHDLAGTAGIFGYPELSCAAQRLEEAARSVDPAGDELKVHAESVLQAVRAQAKSGAV